MMFAIYILLIGSTGNTDWLSKALRIGSVTVKLQQARSRL